MVRLEPQRVRAQIQGLVGPLQAVPREDRAQLPEQALSTVDRSVVLLAGPEPVDFLSPAPQQSAKLRAQAQTQVDRVQVAPAQVAVPYPEWQVLQAPPPPSLQPEPT